MHKHLLILTAACLALSSCSKIEEARKSKPAAPIAVRTIVVQEQAEEGSRTYIGEVEAGSEVALYHALGGRLTALHVHNGQSVHEGQAIADLDDTQPRSLHDAAVATLRQAEDGYERLRQVHQSGGLSDVKWIEMQTNLEKARQQEIATRKQLDDCHITSPVSGIVADAGVRVGQQLYPGQTICSIVGMHTLQAVFTVPESDVASFRIGDSVRLHISALQQPALIGVLTEKGISAGAIAHTYKLKAVILNRTADILPGMIVKVRTTHPLSAGIIIPSAGVQTTPDGPAVWVVRGDSAFRQPIRATQFVKNGVLVTDGLQPGDRIVTAGYQKLYQGAKVTEAR